MMRQNASYLTGLSGLRRPSSLLYNFRILHPPVSHAKTECSSYEIMSTLLRILGRDEPHTSSAPDFHLHPLIVYVSSAFINYGANFTEQK